MTDDDRVEEEQVQQIICRCHTGKTLFWLPARHSQTPLGDFSSPETAENNEWALNVAQRGDDPNFAFIYKKKSILIMRIKSQNSEIKRRLFTWSEYKSVFFYVTTPESIWDLSATKTHRLHL